MSQLVFEHANLPGRSPEILARHAAAAGLSRVSLHVQPFSRSDETWLPGDSASMQDLKDVLDKTGVAVIAVDVFPLRPRLEVESFRPAFEFAAAVGASHALATCATPDRGLLLEQAVAAAELAVEYGVNINLEFTKMGSLPTLQDAISLVRDADRPNLGIALDALHWARSGGTITDIHDAGSAIRHVQLCDALLENPWPTLMDEAMHGRLMPGEGALPLADLLRAVTPDALFGLEVCTDQECLDQTWVDRAAAAARRALAAAGLPD